MLSLALGMIQFHSKEGGARIYSAVYTIKLRECPTVRGKYASYDLFRVFFSSAWIDPLGFYGFWNDCDFQGYGSPVTLPDLFY